MLTVVWLDDALADIQQIAAFIAQSNPRAAHALAEKLLDDADMLAVLPAHYRRGRVAGTHEFVSHPNYTIVYRRTLSAIEILNIVHSRQQYPK
jgi:toxin ParE1/3/4